MTVAYHAAARYAAVDQSAETTATTGWDAATTETPSPIVCSAGASTTNRQDRDNLELLVYIVTSWVHWYMDEGQGVGGEL